MFAVPAAATARTAIHLFTVLVNFLNVYSIRSSLFGPGEIALGAVIDFFPFSATISRGNPKARPICP